MQPVLFRNGRGGPAFLCRIAIFFLFPVRVKRRFIRTRGVNLLRETYHAHFAPSLLFLINALKLSTGRG